jgi:hypothetical protein
MSMALLLSGQSATGYLFNAVNVGSGFSTGVRSRI